MMNKKRYLYILAISVALFILGVLIRKSLLINREEHQSYQNALNQQKEKNAMLEREIIKTRYELISSYEPLANYLLALQENQNRLNTIPTFINEEDGKNIQQILAKNSEYLQQTETLLDRFKSQNAVLKDSLRYFMSLTAELSQNASAPSQNLNLVVTLDELLHDILLYNLTSDEKVASSIEVNIEKLQQQEGDNSLIDPTIRHAKIILSHKPQTDELFSQLKELPTKESMTELDKMYNSYYEEAIHTAHIYHLYVYSWSLMLVGCIGYLVIKKLLKLLLERKYAELALKNLNEELEMRVEDRTNQMTEILEMQRFIEEEQRKEKEKLQQRVEQLQMEVEPVNKGDLTVRAQVTSDEIGMVAESYNSTLENLRKIVAQVQTAAEKVANTTSSNETAIDSLSEGALQQTREMAIALQRIEAMAESARVVVAHAQQAQATVRQSARKLELGDVAMNRTVDKILGIRERVAQTADKIQGLGESSRKISKVVKIIREVAIQTNLLAVNASIEAARAGEQGLGFAVVADEVQSLAQQAAEATREIEKLVKDIQVETSEVVVAMKESTSEVVAETQLVDETRESLNQITTASMEINQLVEAIASEAVEQSQASEVCTSIVKDVAAIATLTSSCATDVSTSFQELLVVAGELQENVGRFKVR